jgi:hypothetical protein
LAEARIELCSGEIPAAQGAGCPCHRLVPLQLAAHAAGPLPVDRDSDIEAGSQHHLRRQRPPRLLIERDLDAAT